ncbi:hypothetical protein ABPG77_000597 [Micractinium sp. CCAP 211/92]
MAVRFRSGAGAARSGQVGTLLVGGLLLAGLLLYKFSTAFATAGSAAVRGQAGQGAQRQQSLLNSLRRQNGGGSGSSGSDSSSSSDGGGNDPKAQFWRIVRTPIAKPDPSIVKQRCGATRGDWCGRYDAQPPIPALPPPRGDRLCLWGCNFVGVCDGTRGWCRCPAGWTGDDCSTRMRRPCSQHHRSNGFEPFDKPFDMQQGGTTMACADLCDEDVGMCYCNSTFPHGRVPADPQLPPGTPPQRVGRPIAHFCRRGKDDAGNKIEFGSVEPELLYGEKGWCQADQPQWTCPCLIDGLGGPYCETPTEAFCPNQCNGHGECHSGWCKCHDGWFGHDCAYRTNTTEWTPGMEDGERPWLKPHVRTPASKDPEPGATRKRPLIYIYELPPMYNSNMLQYRVAKDDCVYRTFTDSNETVLHDSWLYDIETGLHEMLLQSEHRTLDPEEADYFYLPVYTTCFIFPVLGANDFPYFHGGPVAWRTHAATNMLIEVFHWVRSHYPYWDRNGGRDHILLSAHDEGSCWVPAVLRPAIILSHWGRTDLDHISGTGYWPDNYTADSRHDVWQPEGHVGKLGRFPCYNASKDMIIPPMFSPDKYHDSPALGAEPRERHILGFFKGRLQFNNPPYSRGIRQHLTNFSLEQDWWGKHKIFIGDSFPPGEEPGYSRLLTSSTFCFTIMGDGWSSRFEDGLMHGCIPVIIQDGVEVAWSSILDVDSYSIRILQKDMDRIPEILKAVPQAKIHQMQANIAKVWRRHMWTTLPHFQQDVKDMLKRLHAGPANQGPGVEGGQVEALAAGSGDGSSQEGPQGGDQAGVAEGNAKGEGKAKSEGKAKGEGKEGGNRRRLAGKLQPALDGPYNPAEDDAFSTLIQWLYSRLDDLGAHAAPARRL